MTLGVVALIAALATPAALAQCAVSREFGGQGNGSATGRIKIDTTVNGFPNDGNELASIYEAQAPANNNGGDHFGGPNTCGTASWYITGTMFLGALSGIQGFHSTGGCNTPLCPPQGNSLVTVVEDENGADAGFICYATDGTPAAIRYYDHSATAGIAGAGGAQATQVFESYPAVQVTGSSGPPPNTTITNNYSDLGANANVSLAGAPAADGGCVQSYDIMSFHGDGDPGRARGAWTLEKSIAYEGGAVNGDAVAVPCPSTASDTFVAVGATFAGGVQSLLVGSAVQVECDPNLAEPDDDRIDRGKRGRSFNRTKPVGRGR